MAEENDPSSKTEEATPRRLEEARRQGNVAKSADLATWATMAGVASAVAVAGGWLARDLALKLLPFLAQPDAFVLENGGAVEVFRLALNAAAPALLVVLGMGVACGVAGNLLQHGFLWTTSRLAPDLSRLSPMSGFGRLFGIDGLMHFLRSIVKLAIVGVVAWIVLKPHAAEFAGLSRMDLAALLPFAAGILKSLAFAILVFLGVAAGLDFLWQQQRFRQRMRMSREELKDEHRQSEGDPQVKARIRKIRTERARRRMMQAVPKATVVIANPTHYAVALKYEQGETEAPICVAKGTDLVALKIREIAEEARVPVVEDPPLARALYAAVEIDQAIPVDHYQAVAKVIGFVLSQAKKRSRPRRPPRP